MRGSNTGLGLFDAGPPATITTYSNQEHVENYVCRASDEIHNFDYGLGTFSTGLHSQPWNVDPTRYHSGCTADPTAMRLLIHSDMLTTVHNGRYEYGVTMSNKPGTIGPPFAFDGNVVTVTTWNYEEAMGFKEAMVADFSGNGYETIGVTWWLPASYRYWAAKIAGDERLVAGYSGTFPRDSLEPVITDRWRYKAAVGNCFWNPGWGELALWQVCDAAVDPHCGDTYPWTALVPGAGRSYGAEEDTAVDMASASFDPGPVPLEPSWDTSVSGALTNPVEYRVRLRYYSDSAVPSSITFQAAAASGTLSPIYAATVTTSTIACADPGACGGPYYVIEAEAGLGLPPGPADPWINVRPIVLSHGATIDVLSLQQSTPPLAFPSTVEYQCGDWNVYP
ncbi:MAG TPA: hypothetical protein QGF95_07920 [Candidatus Latescibacteria bacterium]|nr:hypothetical protein [Candidatus Latescibacterota bacterium]HJP30466.1 hypothetical protein [Candidatus Latescibacterota bacterium]